MKLPSGFQAAGIKAGIKPSGKPDLAVIYSPIPLYWGLMSTTNTLKAACVARNVARCRSEQPVHGIVVNSGCANTATGERGIWDNEDFAGLAANTLSLPRVQDILTASTGVIGERLPIDKIKAALPNIPRALHPDSSTFAEAILTTDTRPKQVAVTMEGGARIVGVAKGSGMIHPNMATMLAFVMTDADIPQQVLRSIWTDAVDQSFNQISVDGDTSPNDMAFVFSSHQRRVHQQEFTESLLTLCQRLAHKIVQDGEGATKTFAVKVTSARNAEEARRAARAVTVSPLVKSAIHGNDPNWGRILSSVGASGAVMDLSSVVITVEHVTVYDGAPTSFDRKALIEKMKTDELTITVDLAAGDGEGIAWGCDLSAKYVEINAEYTT
jgi:glutamate N-acetyltransferase/amino-acid N-acetyltransferase